jgi:ribosomal protein S18 acetylase RimI-like enzyme
MKDGEVVNVVAAISFSILSGVEAIVATSVNEIRALTSAATMKTYYVDGLDPDQLAANRRVVEISASTCIGAAVADCQHFAAAFNEAGLAGFVVATRHAPDDLELDWMMVHPRHHGSGAASSLMREGLDWLGRAHPIWLSVIRHNERAIRFYRRFGFEIDSAAVTAHAVPHWIMRRNPR